MKIFLAGGYLKDTSNFLLKSGVSRLFSYYDINTKRFNIDKRFKEAIEKKHEKVGESK